MKRLTAVPFGIRPLIFLAFVLMPMAQAQTMTMSKQFLGEALSGDTVQVEYTLTNLTTSFIQAYSFTDDLDAALSGLTVIGTPTSTACGNISGTSVLSFSGSFLAPEASCTFTATIQVPFTTPPGTYLSSTGLLTGNVFGGSAFSDPGTSAELTVFPILEFTKSFLNDPVSPGDQVIVEYFIQNNSSEAVSQVTFTDDLDAALSGLSGTGLPLLSICGRGEMDGTGVLTFSNGGLLPFQACSFQVTLNVPANAPAGAHTVSTSAIAGNLDGVAFTGIAASDDLKVGVPVLSKEFTDDPTFPGGTVTLEYTITNPSATETYTDIQFSDDLDAALAGLSANSLPVAGFCGGGATISGTGVLSMSGGSLGPSDSCSFSVILDVPNDAPVEEHLSTSGNLFATLGVNVLEGEPASDLLDVQGIPVLTKTFTSDPVAPGQQVTVEYHIINLNRSDTATDISFTDDLDAALAGLTAVGLPLADPCGAGSSLSGTGVLTLSGGTLATSETCTFSVTLDVPASTAAGTYNSQTSGVSSQIAGNSVLGPNAGDDLIVEPATLISLNWSDDPAAAGSTATLDITLTNSSLTATASDINFELIFDIALKTASSGPTTTCDGDVVFTPFVNPPPPSDAIPARLAYGFSTPGTLAPGASCTIQLAMDVDLGMAAGLYTHTSSGVSSTVDGVSYTGPAGSDTLVVAAGPRLAMVFTDDPTLPGNTVNLELELTHQAQATTDATDINFTIDLDSVLSGLTATGLPINDQCGLGSSASGTGVITFSGGTLAVNESCVVSLPVLVPAGAVPTDYTITSSTVSSTVSGLTVNSNASSDVLTVAGLLVSKQWLDNPALAGGTATLEYTLANVSPTETVTGIFFVDNLSEVISGMTATVLPPAGSCGAGSSMTGTNFLVFTGGELAPSTTCTLSVTVQIPAGAAVGTYSNGTGNITATLGANLVTLAPAYASLTLIEPLSMSKSFTNDPAIPGTTVDLEFTLTNSHPSEAATMLSFTDDLDAVLSGLVATGLPSGDICGAGSSISGSNLLTFTNGSLAPDSSCTFTVTVQVDAATPLGATGLNITSALSGDLAGVTLTGSPATDTLVITNDGPPGFSMGFSPFSIGALETSTLTFTIDNMVNAAEASNMAFTNNLPADLLVAAIPNVSTDCSAGIVVANAGTGVISFSGGATPARSICSVSVDVTSSIAGTYANLSGDLTSIFGNSGTASNSLLVTESPALGAALQAGAITVNGGGSLTIPLVITLENLGNVPVNQVQVSDMLTATFGAPATYTTVVSSASLTPNPGYNGGLDSNLLAGTDSLAVGVTASLTLSVTLTPNGSLGPFLNQASASATSQGGTAVADASDDGVDPDPNGNGNPNETGENDATPVAFSGSIGDLVYDDLNGNGVNDAGEPGLAGVVVYLDSNANGSLDGGESSTTTDGSGAYDFALVPDTYTVAVDEGTVPPNANNTSANNPTVVALAVLEDNNDVDFGYFAASGEIGDSVWEDLNADGVQDVGEPGIENVTLQLDMSGGGTPVVETTDEFGSYTFSALSAGDYTVTVTDTNNVLDGANLTAGTTPHNKTLTAGENYDAADFGYCFPPVIVDQPQDTELCVGDTLNLSVNAQGSGLTYQWKKGNREIVGATSATLTIPALETSDAGRYRVVISGGCGSVQSVRARVEVDRFRVRIWPPVKVQGLMPLTLSANVTCALEPTSSAWTKVFTNEVVAVDTETFTLPELLSHTTLFKFEMTDANETTIRRFLLVLVPHHHRFLDLNNDACNSYEDLLNFVSAWPHPEASDPNGDGMVDVRDYLYFNLDGCYDN